MYILSAYYSVKIMDPKKTISTTDARKNIFKLTDEVQKPGVHYILTERGRAKAVLMSAEEFDSWRETLEVMEIFPNLKEDIREAEKEFKHGDYITLEELLEKEGYVLKEKAKKEYEMSSGSTEEGTKTAGKNRK